VFLGVLILLYCAAGSYALIISTIFSDKQLAVTLTPVLIIPFMLFAGFFVNQNNIPIWLIEFQYLSFFKYGYQALMLVSLIPHRLNFSYRMNTKVGILLARVNLWLAQLIVTHWRISTHHKHWENQWLPWLPCMLDVTPSHLSSWNSCHASTNDTCHYTTRILHILY